MSSSLEFTEVTDRPWSYHDARDTKMGRQAMVEAGARPQSWADKRQAKTDDRALNKNGRFVAWDGEGVTDEWGVHHYIMLCNSLGDHLINPHGLSTNEILEWVWRYAQAKSNKASINVCFGASYDTNMILHNLPYHVVRDLVEKGTGHWKTWRIEYRPRRELMITRYRPGRHTSSNRWGKSFTLWDCFGFFQCKFTTALAEWDIGLDSVDNITEKKAQRSTFTLERLDTILTYCLQECQALAIMMEELRDRCMAVDLLPSRWDGAGALGTAMLKKHRIKDYMQPTPMVLLDPVMRAYFGGRMELVQWGNHVGKVYGHDLRSAYPHAASTLPCLAHGQWAFRGYGELYAKGFTLCHVRWGTFDKSLRFHPFPLRSKDGTISFPQGGEGWYWWPEVDAALNHLTTGYIQVLGYWSWQPSCDHQPFAFLPSLYAERNRLKKSGDFAEKALKLAMNAGTYGKLAQRTGYQHGKIPSYHQLEWAGYITSTTRARMYDLAMSNPHAVIAFETDGLYSTEPLTDDGDGSLGSWEVTEHDGITYVQSGFYFIATPKAKDGWKAKHRGFDPGTITRERVCEAWEQGRASLSGRSTRFRGMYLASRSDEGFGNWCRWITDDDRTLQLYPAGKRTVGQATIRLGKRTVPVGEAFQLAAGRLLPSIPRPVWGAVEVSVPHALPWVTGKTFDQEEREWKGIMEDVEDYT